MNLSAIEVNNSQPAKKKARTYKNKESATEKIIKFVEQFQPQHYDGHYTLLELINHVFVKKDSPIFEVSIRALFNHLKEKSLIACSLATLQSHCKNYTKDNILPRTLDDGVRKGRPALVSIGNLSKFNEGIKNNIGLTAGSQDMSQQLAHHVQEDRENRGLAPLLNLPTFSRHTVKKYQLQQRCSSLGGYKEGNLGSTQSKSCCRIESQ